MNDLSHVGLRVRQVSAPEGQVRYEVRTVDSNSHVALFHETVRMSHTEGNKKTEPVVNVSTQLVHREELTAAQIEAVQEWQKELVFVALTKNVP